MDQAKRIADELGKLNQKLERILRILEKPEKKEEKVTSTEPKVQIGSGGTYNENKKSEK